MYTLFIYCVCMCMCTQCIIRTHQQQSSNHIVHFPAFIVHFQFFLSSFFHIRSSFYFSICFSCIAIIDVLFSLLPLCTEDYTIQYHWNTQHKRDGETGIAWIWIYWRENRTHSHTHKTESHWILLHAQREQHTLNSTSRSEDTTMNDDIHCKTLACLEWNLLGSHSALLSVWCVTKIIVSVCECESTS